MISKQLEPGSTFIAYINDDESCVGVVIGDADNGKIKDPHNYKTNTLILGWFGNQLSTADRFGSGPEYYPFPTYKEIKSRNIIPYNFKDEIAYSHRYNERWQEGLAAGFSSNLIRRCFPLGRNNALLRISAVQHILAGGGIEEYKGWDYFDDGIFLEFWAILNYLFPKKTKKPPIEWRLKGSNTFLYISYDNDGIPKVTRLHK